MVDESFHVKPLIRILQSADRYYVLGLNRQQIKLFEGNRDALDEVELDPAVPRTATEVLGEESKEAHLSVWSSAPGAGVHHGMASTAELLDNETNRFFRAVDRDPEALFASPRSLFNLGGAAGKSEFIPANQPQSVPDRRRSDHSSRCVVPRGAARAHVGGPGAGISETPGRPWWKCLARRVQRNWATTI